MQSVLVIVIALRSELCGRSNDEIKNRLQGKDQHRDIGEVDREVFIDVLKVFMKIYLAIKCSLKGYL
jgi:hypothetical protein